MRRIEKKQNKNQPTFLEKMAVDYVINHVAMGSCKKCYWFVTDDEKEEIKIHICKKHKENKLLMSHLNLISDEVEENEKGN